MLRKSRRGVQAIVEDDEGRAMSPDFLWGRWLSVTPLARRSCPRYNDEEIILLVGQGRDGCVVGRHRPPPAGSGGGRVTGVVQQAAQGVESSRIVSSLPAIYRD